MGYRCLNCGSEETFSGYQDVTRYESEEIILNSDGDIEDYGDSELHDSEVTDGPYELECDSCGSCNVEWFDSEEQFLERWNEEHPNEEVDDWKEKIKGNKTTWKQRIEANTNA
jgi:hypothetical protein